LSLYLGRVLVCRRRKSRQLILILILVVFVFVGEVDGVGVFDAATRAGDVRFVGAGHAAGELLGLVGIRGLDDAGRGDEAGA